MPSDPVVAMREVPFAYLIDGAFCHSHGVLVLQGDGPPVVNLYAEEQLAAVRRATLDAVRAKVGGMREKHREGCSSRWSAEPNYPFCDCDAGTHNSAVDAIFTVLDELEKGDG